MPPRIVVDANIAAGTILPIHGLETSESLFAKWAELGTQLYAPDVWLSEMLSAIRQHVYRNLISPASAKLAVENIFHLEVSLIAPNMELCQRALEWAERIGQSKAYDALYLAVAEHLQAEFWTADRNLVDAAQKAGTSWAKLAGKN